MKLLVLILLLANAAMFAWYSLDRPAPALDAERPAPAHQLRLLSELQEQPSVAGRAAAKPGARQCYAAGPMRERAAASLEQSLRAQGLSVHLDRQEQLEPLGYWVYLPPADSLEEAQAMGLRLADKGVTDYVFVVGAEKANAISLGLYPDQPAAEIRAAQLQSLGFEPRMEKRFSRTAMGRLVVVLDQGEPPRSGVPGGWRPVDCQPSRQ